MVVYRFLPIPYITTSFYRANVISFLLSIYISYITNTLISTYKLCIQYLTQKGKRLGWEDKKTGGRICRLESRFTLIISPQVVSQAFFLLFSFDSKLLQLPYKFSNTLEEMQSQKCFLNPGYTPQLPYSFFYYYLENMLRLHIR